MSLISKRPDYWSGIAGQGRAIKVLQALLKANKFLLRGFIFEGVRGVGKTTTAYIHARALMCQGIDPLGCGTGATQCPSCLLIDTKGIDQHPDFREVDAASNSGVEAARAILEQGTALPILAKRRVTMIDEAHRLSREAFDAYLKPLEAKDTDTIFIFVTNSPESIPDTITSRCCRIRFTRVAEDVILGLLSAIASENGIKYEQEALRLLAKTSKGLIRDAVKMLDIVAAMGDVTVELVDSQMETSLDSGCADLFTLLLASKHKEAAHAIDTLGQQYAPAKIIEAMFGIYAKAVFTDELKGLVSEFGDIPGMTGFFIKWSGITNLTADVLPLFLFELGLTRAVQPAPKSMRIGVSASAPAPPKDLTPDASVLTAREAAQLLGAKIG